MKNLYNIINISPESSAEEIESYLGFFNQSEDIDDAKYVLLNKERRNVYDRNRRACIQIGLLRANLEISNTNHWSKEKFRGFDFPKTASTPLLKKIFSNASPATTSIYDKLKSDLRSQPFLLGTIAMALCLILFATFYFKSNPETLLRNKPSASKANEYTNNWWKNAEPVDNSSSKTTNTNPYTGIFHQSYKYGVAPLSIKTARGSNYFIKIQNSTNNNVVLTAFIRGGETLDTLVPLGSYTIKYASGMSWLGEDLFFGDQTSYSLADEIFKFKKDKDGYLGFTVELISQINGNLSSKSISKNKF